MPLSKKQKAIIALLDDRIPPLKDAVGVIPPDPPVFPLVIQPDPPVPLSIEDRRLIARRCAKRG